MKRYDDLERSEKNERQLEIDEGMNRWLKKVHDVVHLKVISADFNNFRNGHSVPRVSIYGEVVETGECVSFEIPL